ncbi:diacylglycerol acyltransferase-like protein [Leptotrombidium deliense]|uniref:diacylglycerol O-acyltransferase n=1 Tax=Leptotrombidium deliense TaxID=299467 RepID=A0A443SAE1_9ACAR|nr:diacylglycerol acyltransferase-like protein [Leptotrombidium deliense]
MPFSHGRGIFQYNMGYLPFRKPVNTIVGKPIKVAQISKPSQEVINKYHDLYVKSLCDLFYEHREKYSEDPNVEIVIK